jgi:hypothetical protein
MINEKRWQHILGVARKAKFLAEQLAPQDEKYQEDMFLLGMLHDFGYEFASFRTDHPAIAAEILKRNGYRYSQEVAWHGDSEVETMSDALFILNLADMTTLPDGTPCGLNERIAEIESRFGTDSVAQRKAVALSNKITSDQRYQANDLANKIQSFEPRTTID